MKFAYKLQELRKGSGMSQEEFAELLGVSRQSVSKWESGKGYPEIDKLIFISNYFNTSLDLLLKDTTDYPNSNPSLNSNRSTRGSKKNKKKTINLTKSQSDHDSSNQTVYISDPMPNKKKESYSLRKVNVSSNAQLRPIKNHVFGNRKRKFNHLRVLKASVLGIVLVVSIVAIIGGVTEKIIDESTTIEAQYIESTVQYEDDVAENDYSYYDWDTLYDDTTNSDLENQMLSDIDSQEQSLLADTSGNVYYTGYDIVCTYYDAQTQMQDELNCMLLYQKYVSFKEYRNCNFKELYSADLDSWVIINNCMLREYDESNDTIDFSFDTFSYDDFDDILSNDDNYSYDDWNTYPFEEVFIISKQSNASVAMDILNLCLEATYERKLFMSMSQYIDMYEDYDSKYELVKYDVGNVAFVPKNFIMVNLSDLEDSE